MNLEKIFIVKEEWQIDAKLAQIAMSKQPWFFFTGADEIIFNEGTNNERFQKAKKHLDMRFGYIATRRCLSEEWRQAKFIITLLSVENLNGNSKSEILQQWNETNYPIPEELKGGLFQIKK